MKRLIIWLLSIALGTAPVATFAQYLFDIPAHEENSLLLKGEYFFDVDPGFDQASSFIWPSGQINVPALHLPIAPNISGFHRVGFRVKTQDGRWSITQQMPVIVWSQQDIFPPTSNGGQLVGGEYFIDTDPGLGNGSVLLLSGDTDTGNVMVSLSNVSEGFHTVFFRAKDSNGNWSHVSNRKFSLITQNLAFIYPHQTPEPVTFLEYFFDNDPGFGNGSVLAVPATSLLSNFAFDANTLNLQQDSQHTLFVRVLSGSKSHTYSRVFTIGTPLTLQWLTFSGLIENKKVSLQWEIINEQESDYFTIERSVDGKAFSAIGKVSSLKKRYRTLYEFADYDPPEVSTIFYRVRLQDMAGNSSYSKVLTIIPDNNFKDLWMENPVLNDLIIRSKSDISANIEFSIINSAGKRCALAKGNEQKAMQIATAHLSPGMYLLVIKSVGKNRAIKFLK